MWRPVGTITPQLDWRILPYSTYSRTFRFTYLGVTNETSSHILLRQYYANDLVSKTIRFYPKREQEVVELPVFQDFANDLPSLVRRLGVKRVIRKRYGFIQRDSNWSLKVEEWL